MEGLITKWLKQGDAVSEGQGICEVETEKPTDEIQAHVSGILLKILCKEGAAVPVNSVIAVIVSAGEDLSSIPELLGPTALATARPPTEPAKLVLVPRAGPEASPERIRISPIARRLAREHGIDITKIRGTGRGGRIVAEDALRVSSKAEGSD
jgi:pyruvate/2-oxoglutarate dehydrogenase complex dihydrolipoamide acyltransferase (E2) component